MRNNRILIFNNLVDFAATTGDLLEFKKKFGNYDGWEKFNFKNDSSVTEFHKKLNDITSYNYGSDLNEKLKIPISELKKFSILSLANFFKNAACDILTTSTYCSAAQTQQQQTQQQQTQQQQTQQQTQQQQTQQQTPTPIKAVVIQRGDYNLKVAGSDAIIY